MLYVSNVYISVQFSHSAVSDSLWLHESQHTRPPCPSPTPGAHSNSCPLSRGCHPAISSSVVPFSSCSQSFPAWGSFQISQLFTSGGQSIRVSASKSVLPMNTQDWSPLISLLSKGLSRIFFFTTVGQDLMTEKQFFFKLFSHLGYYRILSSIPCAILGPCWLSISNIAVCIC